MKASGFPCYILNNTHFFWNWSRKSKKLHDLGKSGDVSKQMVYPEGTFLWWGLFIPSFKSIACVVDKQNDICRGYLLLQGLCMPSVKTTTYACNRFDTSFFARDHKTNQAISNLNRKFWNKSTQQIKSTISLTDLCFNKKIWTGEKKFI